MKIKEGYKVREMAGEHVIIKQGRFGAATSLLLWQELQGRDFEVEDVAKVLTDNYEVEAATATADAAAWMEKLVEAGLAE